MPDYLTPGTYVEEVTPLSRQIEGVPTATCAFIGRCSGVDNESPVEIRSLTDFEFAFPASKTAVDDIWLAVRGFYDNGGGTAWICPVVAAGDAAPDLADYERALNRVMLDLTEVTVLLYPDQQWQPNGNAILQGAALRCEAERRCMLLIDPPAGYEFTTERSVHDLHLPEGSFLALYYPWLEVLSPQGLPRWMPPSALMAGIWARIDSLRGVWKSPAGLDADVRGIAGLEHQVPRLTQNTLNPLGVNCIRSFPGRGTMVWGARTRTHRSDSEWRYLSVRRTLTYIQQSIAGSTQWTVFEVNDASLWSALRTSVEAFLYSLFREGALQGATPSDAYYVRCGLGQTMTAQDILEGRVIVEVGVAAQRPAEFVVLVLPLATTS